MKIKSTTVKTQPRKLKCKWSLEPASATSAAFGPGVERDLMDAIFDNMLYESMCRSLDDGLTGLFADHSLTEIERIAAKYDDLVKRLADPKTK